MLLLLLGTPSALDYVVVVIGHTICIRSCCWLLLGTPSALDYVVVVTGHTICIRSCLLSYVVIEHTNDRILY